MKIDQETAWEEEKLLVEQFLMSKEVRFDYDSSPLVREVYIVYKNFIRKIGEETGITRKTFEDKLKKIWLEFVPGDEVQENRLKGIGINSSVER